jgi:hypothetical protein
LSLLKRLVAEAEIIFSLAAQVSYIDSNTDPFLDLDISCRGHLNLLETCRYVADVEVLRSPINPLAWVWAQLWLLVYSPVTFADLWADWLRAWTEPTRLHHFLYILFTTSWLARKLRSRDIVPVPDARELMCTSDVFVLSSDYGGMPNVVLEAMAVRGPCVCTSVNGVGALTEPGVNGFITDHRADALAEKVLLLVRDEKLREEMGAIATKRIKGGSFDPNVIAARLWQLCE